MNLSQTVVCPAMVHVWNYTWNIKSKLKEQRSGTDTIKFHIQLTIQTGYEGTKPRTARSARPNNPNEQLFLARVSRRLTRWAYRMGLEPASVRASTFSNMSISETSRPITIKCYLKHHWDGGKAALGFGADQIRTLVSMVSSHTVIMGKRASSRFLGC